MLTYVVLKILGVPFAELIAVFDAIADLIPLIGATLGAVIAALIHSLPAAITVVFFVVYQQLENHLLQPVIFSRTVKLNPSTGSPAMRKFSGAALGAVRVMKPTCRRPRRTCGPSR